MEVPLVGIKVSVAVALGSDSLTTLNEHELNVEKSLAKYASEI